MDEDVQTPTRKPEGHNLLEESALGRRPRCFRRPSRARQLLRRNVLQRLQWMHRRHELNEACKLNTAIFNPHVRVMSLMWAQPLIWRAPEAKAVDACASIETNEYKKRIEHALASHTPRELTNKRCRGEGERR